MADDGRKFIFKGNHLTKTKICDSNQQPHADKSPKAQQADRPSRPPQTLRKRHFAAFCICGVSHDICHKSYVNHKILTAYETQNSNHC
ncbi:MAG: hypothetical protein IKA04_06815, partial [Alistipes sp.]|nr:hypothetical protein [Alistipes sp.]